VVGRKRDVFVGEIGKRELRKEIHKSSFVGVSGEYPGKLGPEGFWKGGKLNK